VSDTGQACASGEPGGGHPESGEQKGKGIACWNQGESSETKSPSHVIPKVRGRARKNFGLRNLNPRIEDRIER
jgi:hypothetical protein